MGSGLYQQHIERIGGCDGGMSVPVYYGIMYLLVSVH